jgi:hypothetical protein
LAAAATSREEPNGLREVVVGRGVRTMRIERLEGSMVLQKNRNFSLYKKNIQHHHQMSVLFAGKDKADYYRVDTLKNRKVPLS